MKLIIAIAALLLPLVGVAGGTVTNSQYIVLQRSGIPLSATTNPKLDCPAPKTLAECDACLIKMYKAEIARRTTGYVTYKCVDTRQSYVKFSNVPLPPVPVPPVVTPPPTAPAGGATISWKPSTKNIDGTALTNLAGYRIYYGTSAFALDKMVQVGPGVTAQIIENLTPGSWYFSVRAYTTAGIESDYSNVTSKVIR